MTQPKQFWLLIRETFGIRKIRSQKTKRKSFCWEKLGAGHNVSDKNVFKIYAEYLIKILHASPSEDSRQQKSSPVWGGPRGSRKSEELFRRNSQ